MNIKKLLDENYMAYNKEFAISDALPDPMLIARKYKDEFVALICALFAYGSAKQIVKFLQTLDFSLLSSSPDLIKKSLQNHKYRFQNSSDVAGLFVALRKLKDIDSLENIFKTGYKQDQNVLKGIQSLINALQKQSIGQKSLGYNFLLSNADKTSALKRWNMYLRWMVRKDNIDLGLWSGVDTKDLIIPLDVNVYKTAKILKLVSRKSKDIKTAQEITQNLSKFCKNDPVKYDFALYRLGQTKALQDLEI